MTNQEAIEDIRNNIKPIVGGKSLDMAIEALEERETGRWIEGGYACGETEWICSECGFTEWRTSNSRMKFCMNCGARMEADPCETT